MILAAGLGTRLRPLTDDRPKALVEVAGVPMLERVARALIDAGVGRLIVNVHHHAGMIERFVRERDGFGVEVRISREEGPAPLETGGGLLAAAGHFESGEPFFLHNVDVISDLDLPAMYARHLEFPCLATLAASRRETSRPLLVDDRGVFGVADRRSGWRREARRAGTGARESGFAGIHVVSPRIFPLLTEQGTFSIIDAYMRLIADGHRISVFDIGETEWHEVGTPRRLERARRRLEARERSGRHERE